MYLTELANINKLLNPSSSLLLILAEIVADILCLISGLVGWDRGGRLSVIIKPFVGIFARQGSQYLIV